MKRYRGFRERGIGGAQVTVLPEAGRPYPLNPRFDVRNHSPDGFQWGYAGSGPAQLALALLCDALGDVERAQQHYQPFKFAWLSGLHPDTWTFTDEAIRAWVEAQEAPAALQP